MGMQITGQGGPKRGRRGRYKPLAEINVTPFVDVMLVLLIIFMVAAPLLVPGINVDTPNVPAPPLPQDQKPLEVAVDQNGAIFLAENEVELEELAARLRAIAGESAETRIYVRGDRRNDYGRVMQVISTINQAGFTKVSLIADPAPIVGGSRG